MKNMGMIAPHWYRSWIRGKTRIGIAWVFAAWLIFSAREYPNLPGILVCFFGATIRFWASGYLRKDSKLSLGGPYAFTRNPLYLGTLLMAAGTAISISNAPLAITVTIVFALVYHYIILDEEEKLVGLMGAPYEAYLKAVPRFFPRPLPVGRAVRLAINPSEEHLKFSWKLAMKNKAYEAYVTFALLIGLVAAVAAIWERYQNTTGL